jgi:hypothetical protein
LKERSLSYNKKVTAIFSDNKNELKRLKDLRRGPEQTSQGLRRKRDQVEGPLYEEAGKSAVKAGSFHTNYWMAVES